MLAHPLLLFGDLQWLKVVFVILFILIWVFNHLVGEKAKAKARPQRPPIPPPQPDLPGADRRVTQQPLVGEIEKFLMRAKQKQQEKGRRKQTPKVVPAEVPPRSSKPARRLVQTSTRDQDFEVTVGRSVADHVEQHLDTREFAERAAHLVDDVSKNDAEREAHRKQMFEHKLGHLADTSTAAAAFPAAGGPSRTEAAAAVVSLASLLADPQNLKQAIVLSEIFSRPEHRW